jgi:4-nitrophenyl phosphatase
LLKQKKMSKRMMTDGTGRPEEVALQDVAAFIFDMDGVIYRGEVVVPGAADFLAGLRRRNIPYVFLTNNSTTPSDKVAARLARMGVQATPDEVLTSADVTAAALADEMPGGRVLLVGEEGIHRALAERGFQFTEDHRDADIVVVGMDRQFTYAKAQEAGLAIRGGAAFVATNTDRSLPTPIGLVPGAGSIVAMLEAATDVQARVFGKPSPGIYLYALPRLGVPAHRAAAVGDRPETDIIGGQQAGMRTIGVLTGVGTKDDFAAMQPPPDWVFEDLVALGAAYFSRT